MTSFQHFDTGAVTHQGNVRSANEDSYVVLPETGIWAVADGVGGANAGDLASRTVTASLRSVGQPVSAADLLARVEDRIIRAHQRIKQLEQQRQVNGMGTTLAALLVGEGHYGALWSGDSRVYLVRDGAISQITHDHSEAQQLVDEGVLTAAEAKNWRRRNVITRAIGFTTDPELDLTQGPLKPGDAFVVCSDGLTVHVDDDEIAATVRGAPSAQAACDKLLALTLARGATDNVTVVVVNYRPSAVG